MKNKTKVVFGICAVSLGLALSAQATTFDLTFTDFNSVVQGYGAVTGTENPNGSYTMTGGYWDVVAGPEAGMNGTLLPNPNSPSVVNSPSGYFDFDSILFPNTPGLATVDYWGLLFSTGNSPSEINLYSDSPAQYDEYFNNGVDILGTLTVNELTPGAAPTPDGASCAMLLGCAFIGLAGVRRLLAK